MELVTIEMAAVLSALTSISSIFGDLFESYLKREAGLRIVELFYLAMVEF